MRRVAAGLLLIFVFAVPWEYSLDLGKPFGNVARIAGLLLLAAAIPAVLSAGRMRRLSTLHWVTLALLLWFCCSYFWTVAPEFTLAKLRGYAQEMMLVWLVWEFADDAGDLRNLLRAWLAGSWVLAVLTLTNAIGAAAESVNQIRFVAAGQDANDLARYLDFAFPIAALLIDGREHWLGKLLAASYFPLGFASVLLTGSRSGFLTCCIALAGCAALAAKRNTRRALLAGPGILLIAAAVWMVIPPGTVDRLATIAEQLRSPDLNQRVMIWSSGWRAFAHAPIAGHGAGAFVNAARLGFEDTAHNAVLALGVEGGLIAVGLAMAIVLVCARSVVSLSGCARIAMATLMAVWLASSVVASTAESRTTWLLFAVVALSARISSEEQEGPTVSTAQTVLRLEPAQASR